MVRDGFVAKLEHDGVGTPGVLVGADYDGQFQDVQRTELMHDRERVQAIQGILVRARKDTVRGSSAGSPTCATISSISLMPTFVDIMASLVWSVWVRVPSRIGAADPSG